MGRKKSLPPEPLALLNGGQREQQDNLKPNAHSVKSKPTHVAQTQQRLGETDQRMSPAPTASPNSPRSPFSKYNSHQSHAQQQQQQQHTLATTPNRHNEATTPTGLTIASSRKQPHIAELQQQPHTPHDLSRFPPITSTTSASPPRPPKAQTQERRLKSSHGRRHGDEKHLPKQGFFFNFSKTTKSSDRLPTQTQGLQSTTHPAREAMSGADQPAVAKTSSKQSGKQMPYLLKPNRA